MSSDYTYSLEQCDVQDKRRLEQYRAKRVVWLSWLETDEHHAIWSTIQSMVWTDVAFRCLTGFTTAGTPTSLENTLLAEALINGYFATQILAIRRLVDRGSDVISLPRLVKDIKAHANLLTREHYVCHDGLPYDWKRVQREEMSPQVGRGGRGIWVSTTGPTAWGTSQMVHDQFDRLSKVSPDQRQRDDLMAASILHKMESWLSASGAVELSKWSSVYLAHAGGPKRRASTLTLFMLTALRAPGKARMKITKIRRSELRCTLCAQQKQRGRVFRLNTTDQEIGARDFEDLCAIADLSAGMLSDVSSRLRNRNWEDRLWTLEGKLPPKADLIADWFWDDRMTLRKTLITIDLHGTGFGVRKMSRLASTE
ncbi:hypothetical protein AB8Z38_16245 [Bradyrhizobium sp. LLZ17]|uniref:Uncharacterized protein n=1 Tax=Bradyrhizobium sp. LLZ17 TaxID=3239388 RepID=A0AB39XSI1_9BRAD